MYIWRRWRDTVVYCFLCLVVSIPLVTYPLRSPRMSAGAIETSWLLLGVPVGLLIGLLIGSRSIGTEVGAGYGDFIMTRPRSRGYFVWTGWAVGVAEVFGLLAIAETCNAGAIYYQDRFFLRQMPATLVDIPMLLTSVAVFTLVV